jgi:hypothetical protein
MTQPDGLRRELNATLDELRTLRDEIRLQLHLAGMEAKTKWDRDLEPRLFRMEKAVEREAAEGSRAAMRELAESMKRFRDSLKRN